MFTVKRGYRNDMPTVGRILPGRRRAVIGVLDAAGSRQ